MNNWSTFWKNENIVPASLTELNIDIFIKSTTSILDFNSQDVIMDIGSGDCQLASKLHDKVKEIHCLDISEQNLIKAQKKLKQYKNIHYHLLDESNYTELPVIKEEIKFTKIICLSVVQYYQSKDDLEKLIKQMKRSAAPGAKSLIADMPTTKLSVIDILLFLNIAWNNNLLFTAMLVIVKAWLSGYYKIGKHRGLLYYSIEFIRDLLVKNNLKGSILTNQITINKRRIHLLIDF